MWSKPWTPRGRLMEGGNGQAVSVVVAALGAPVEFRVLGPVEVWAGGRRVSIGHAKQRSVLAVLVIDLGRVVTAEQLIDRVWGEDPPRSVRNVLSGYVTRLRA